MPLQPLGVVLELAAASEPQRSAAQTATRRSMVGLGWVGVGAESAPACMVVDKRGLGVGVLVCGCGVEARDWPRPKSGPRALSTAFPQTTSGRAAASMVVPRAKPPPSAAGPARRPR